VNNPDDLHSWSEHLRQEALQEARTRHLVKRTRAERGEPGQLRRGGLTYWDVCWRVCRGARLAG
jgi:hypothetical protein